MEWVFKWLKILLTLGLCILMIIIKAGGQSFHLAAFSLGLLHTLTKRIVGPGVVESSKSSSALIPTISTKIDRCLRLRDFSGV